MWCYTRILTLLTLCSLAWTLNTEASSTSSSSICPSRTANYITHHLPQQCLATSRSIVNATTNETQSDATETAHAEHTSTDGLNSGEPSAAISARGDTSANVPAVAPNATSEGPSSPAVAVEVEPARSVTAPEEDSALESGSFLSFEEWKKQNLKKAGQSEHIARRKQSDAHEPRHRPDRMQISLESLGDDGEIDLDFSGFVPGGPEKPPREVSLPVSEDPKEDRDISEGDQSGPPAAAFRSKDAGTTCKERFNYASFDCAANVLKANKEAKNYNTVLVENKDSYMLNRCSAQDKFIILELCDDILIDTVVLANFEFFSSTFRMFRVSVSDRYPVKIDKWKALGTYEARNTREVQAFLVEDPVIWARYLRIDFMSHYGNEFYCPVSLVRVHGTTMMEDWKHLVERASDEDEDESSETDHVLVQGQEVESLTPEAVAIHPQTSTEDPATTAKEPKLDELDSHHLLADTTTQATDPVHTSTIDTPASFVAMEAIMSVIELSDTCLSAEGPEDYEATPVLSTTSSPSTAQEPSPPVYTRGPETSALNASQRFSETDDLTTAHPDSLELGKNMTEYHSRISATGSPTQPVSQLSSTGGSLVSTDKTTSKSATSSTKTNVPVSSSSERVKSSQTSSHTPAPSTQDSFFKSVQKRLQMLEANSSMSLQYIEDQSRALRDAFKKVEQRQLARTNTFLDQLNQTVLNELREFRQQYDQLWQSTVIELELQRERYERDNKAINARIGILADEVIFQRRIVILQMVLILVCLVLVLFSRGAINNYLELPIVQNVLARSPNSRWLNLSSDSVMRPTQPVRTRSAHQLRSERTGVLKGHQRMQSEDSITDAQSGNEIYAPLTPVSDDYGQSEVELVREETKSPISDYDKDENNFGDPEFDPTTIARPATSPPMLKLNGGSPISDEEAPETENIASKLAKPSDALPPTVHDGEFPNTKRLSWKLPGE